VVTQQLHIYKNEGRELGQEPFPTIVTGTLTVKYLLPVSIRKPIILRAKIKESSGKKIIVSCSVFSRKKLCATGEVIVIRVGQ
jgi:acyl-CoA thioesterase FadM